MSHKVFIVSGEASGDLHGAHLIQELQTIIPDVIIDAWGGDRMASMGAHILKHYRDLAFMGFLEVFKNITTIWKNFSLIKQQILASKPDIVILIDYPGFNLRLLSWLKKNQFPVIYYIAPQAWAWKENRVKKMAKYVDKLFVILPFEEEFFATRGIHTRFVGHPLLQNMTAPEMLARKRQIALMPGSRKQEIKYILPILASIVPMLPDFQWVIAAMRHIPEHIYTDILGDLPVKIIWDQSEMLLAESELVLVSSGTATLQAALYETPLIVCYKTGKLNYEIGKRLIHVPYISLVNLIAGRPIIKELIQNSLTSENLLNEIHHIYSADNYETIKEEMRTIRKMLGNQNASKEVALEIAHILQNY